MTPKPNDKFYILWSGGIFLCLLLALTAVIYASVTKGVTSADTADEPTQQVSEPDTPAAAEDETPNLDSSCVLAQSTDQGSDYLGQFVFLGDVTTYDLQYYYALPKAQVWTTSDHSLRLSDAATAQIVYPETGESMPLAQALSQKQPAYFVITLGREDLALGKDAFMAAYSDLIHAVWDANPSTKIICQSVFPVEDGLETVTNTDVNTVNAWIIQVCEQMGCRYLNTYEVLADPSGALISDYSTGDGIQISALGCNAITNYVRTHPYA